MTPTYITQVPIYNDYISQFLPRDFWFALIYKEIPDLAFFEENFISPSKEPSNPLLVPGTNKLVGFWEMLELQNGSEIGIVLEKIADIY